MDEVSEELESVEINENFQFKPGDIIFHMAQMKGEWNSNKNVNLKGLDKELKEAGTVENDNNTSQRINPFKKGGMKRMSQRFAENKRTKRLSKSFRRHSFSLGQEDEFKGVKKYPHQIHPKIAAKEVYAASLKFLKDQGIYDQDLSELFCGLVQDPKFTDIQDFYELLKECAKTSNDWEHTEGIHHDPPPPTADEKIEYQETLGSLEQEAKENTQHLRETLEKKYALDTDHTKETGLEAEGKQEEEKGNLPSSSM